MIQTCSRSLAVRTAHRNCTPSFLHSAWQVDTTGGGAARLRRAGKDGAGGLDAKDDKVDATGTGEGERGRRADCGEVVATGAAGALTFTPSWFAVSWRRPLTRLAGSRRAGAGLLRDSLVRGELARAEGALLESIAPTGVPKLGTPTL